MQVAVCGPNLRDQSKGQLHVHASDCADLKRSNEPEYQHAWVFEAGSKDIVIQEIYPPDQFEYDPKDPIDYGPYVEEVYFFPCTKDLLES